jgi:superfamily I DNA/RNA helicase
MYVEYEAQLREAGVVDFNDLIALALTEIRERPLETQFAAVIVDEVQDLSCQALRLLAEISGGGERLLVVGDGQQQIYPGGYTLAEAGISVTGRSTVLRTNYRNAANILATSAELVVDDEYNDLDDTTERGQRDVVSVRDGGQVWKVELSSSNAVRSSAVSHIRNLIAYGHAPAGIALLCATNDAAKAYLELLSTIDIPAMKLSDYVGQPVDAVKVGTYQRAKGLEFKDVVLPLHDRASAVTASVEAQQEDRERNNRALFVAMTRARDTLWIGRLAHAGNPTI